MHYFVHVAVAYCRKQLVHYIFDSFFTQVLFFHDSIKELATIAELHYNIEVNFLLVHINNPDDVRVILY